MQVHAVPEAERAFHPVTGQRLPWAYEYYDPEVRTAPEERGPFGKATRRRGISRSKTTTPARKEDLAQLENQRVQDEIFASWKKSLPSPQKQKQSTTDQSKLQASAPAATATSVSSEGEPTEVMFYGYSSDQEWAAIEFYERVSGGGIYEDYERRAPAARFSAYAVNTKYSGTIPKAALAKRNRYAGGDHWIKVTFDSAEAADRACEASPHIICGHVVYAERYRGLPPSSDVPIPASAGQGLNLNISPSGTSTTLQNTHSPNSSTTATSATATATTVTQPAQLDDPFVSPRRPQTKSAMSDPRPTSPTSPTTVAASTALPAQTPLRIRGAKRVVLRPASEALLPSPPWWQRFLTTLPLIGWLFVIFLGAGEENKVNEGGGGWLIGQTVPRKDDGSFDWESAGFYWRTCWVLDRWLGMSFSGLELLEDQEDEE